MTPDPGISGAVFGGVMAVAAWYRHERHPFPAFGPANWITTARAALVALVAGLVTAPRTPAIAVMAVSLGLLTTVLDGADGWVARHTGTASDFGARFDMEVDALLILILSILVWQFAKAGVWVILSGLLRYLFVAAGTVTPWIEQPLPPSRRRQTVCVLQIGGLLIALTPCVVPPISTFVAASALAALVYSFSVDVLWLSHRAA
jgi:phosphatidylglycerophosphate synthase